MTLWSKEILSEMHKLDFSEELVSLCRIFLSNETYAKVKNW
jgi:hypothetical protein